MELGTEDIFLEANRKPNGVVQRFGNEGTAEMATSATGNYSAMGAGIRKAVVAVRPTTFNNGHEDKLDRRDTKRRGTLMRLQTVANPTSEPLERKIELEHLQSLAPYFLKPSATKLATATTNVFHELNGLKRNTEVDEWLHGCGEPVADWSSLVKRKVPMQFSHIRSTQEHTKVGEAKSSLAKATLAGNLSSAVSDDGESLEEADSPHWTRGSKLRAEKLSSLLTELFAKEKVSLTEQQFADAICGVVPGTTKGGAAELFQRIDVESTNLVSWDSFVAFLLSQTSSSSANPAVTQSTEFMPISVPRSCPSWQQHESAICSITVNLRTGVVYTGGSDGALRSWDATTLRHQRLWYTCNSWIVGLVLTFRELRLVCTTVDRQLVVFDAKSGDILRMYRGRRVLETENGVSFAHDSIPTVTIGGKVQSHLAPKGARIRTGGPPIKSGADHSEDVRVHLDAERANQVEKRKLEEFILAGLVEAPSCIEYHFSRLDEDVLFFGMADGSVRLYILPVGQQRLVRRHFKLKPHTGRVQCLKVVPDLEGLLSCSEDGSIKLTNLETGQVAKHYGKLGDGHEGGVSSFVYSASMKLFLSAGPERHALVWDQLQESPVARLDDHSCPLLCCTINDQERQFISIGTDNSVFIFDARSYKLMQQFQERVRSNVQSLTTAAAGSTGASAQQQGYSVAWFDVPRQRLILCTTFPTMHQLRRNVATLPATYCGHTSPVVGVIVNRSFDLLLTIDAEHLVLGWTVATGASSGLSFRLNSFTSAHEELRLTSLAFDTMERRLVTGFHCGVVVVWNVFNGQPLCIVRSGGGEALAVATLQRDSDCTHYLFSLGSHLVPLKDTAQFTVANAPRWPVPEPLGVVTCLAPCSPVLVACGTSTGALFFFNALLEHQEGSALFQPVGRGGGEEGVLAGEAAVENGGSNVSRVVGVFALPRVAGKTVAVVHADGVVGFWHSVRRCHVTTVTLSSVGVLSGNVVLCAVDAMHEHLVTVDDSGNVAVLALRFVEAGADKSSFCVAKGGGTPLCGSDKLSLVLDEVGATVVHEERAVVSSDPYAIYTLAAVERVSYFYGLTGAQTGLATVTSDHGLFVVITASDFFTRVFDSSGRLVGELGMNTWNLVNDRTFKYPNAVHSPFAVALDVGESYDVADELPFQLEVPGTVGGGVGASLLVPKPPSTSGSTSMLGVVGGSSYQLPRAFRDDAPSSAAGRPVQPHGTVQLGNPSPRVKSQREGLVRPAVPSHERRFSSFSVEEYPGASDVTPQLTLTSAQLLAHTGSNSSFVATPYRDKKSTATRAGTVGFSGLTVPAPTTVLGTPGSARKSVSTEALSPPRDESLASRGANPVASPGSGNLEGTTETRRAALLARHLDSQLTKLRSCKDDLTEELKRIEARLARRPETSYVAGSGVDKSSWTSRVAARLQLHDIDDIQPPAGSKASSDTGRRVHHRFAKAQVANTGRAQQRPPDFFPSVTAPGTVLVGEKSKDKS